MMTDRAKARRLICSIGLFAAVLAASGPRRALAQPSPAATPAKVEAELLAAEDQFFRAQVAHDAAALSAVMADEAIFGHANGMRQSKDEYLKAFAGGALPYKSVEPRDRTARVFGDVGDVHGVVTMVVGDLHLTDSYLAVYVKRQGRWLLLDWQSAQGPRPPGQQQPPPGAPPRPPTGN